MFQVPKMNGKMRNIIFKTIEVVSGFLNTRNLRHKSK